MGAMFVGLLLGSIFYGITILQTISYYSTYTTDKVFLKLLVAMLWILDTLSLAMIAHGLYIYLISDYMDPLALAYMSWSLSTEPIVSGAVALIVHFFLCHRIAMLNKRWRLYAIFLAVFAIAPFSMAMVSSIKTVSGGAETWLNMPDFKALADAGNIMTSVLDILIAGTICVQLHQGRSGLAKSDAMIQLIILYTITTGLLPTLVSLGDLIAYSIDPDNMAFFIFNILVSKAYANTLLATLNSRGSIRSRGAETEISAKFSSMRFRAGGDEPSATSNSSTELDSITDLPDSVSSQSRMEKSVV